MPFGVVFLKAIPNGKQLHILKCLKCSNRADCGRFEKITFGHFFPLVGRVGKNAIWYY